MHETPNLPVSPRARNDLSAGLFLELIKLIRHENLASRRAYPHVHVALFHELSCLLHGRSRSSAAKINPGGLIVSADEVFEFGRPSHAGARPP
jgi:hypothetical protein